MQRHHSGDVIVSVTSPLRCLTSVSMATAPICKCRRDVQFYDLFWHDFLNRMFVGLWQVVSETLFPIFAKFQANFAEIWLRNFSIPWADEYAKNDVTVSYRSYMRPKQVIIVKNNTIWLTFCRDCAKAERQQKTRLFASTSSSRMRGCDGSEWRHSRDWRHRR